MTMSKDRRELYPSMITIRQMAVDRAYDAVAEVLKEHDLKVIGDDRAENLVGAIARFVEDCNK